jgi:pimeloyl-ACP methyl ester carboxylesterase
MPYVDVNGLHLYYEQHGEGPPLVLLHGGLVTIELNFGVVIPPLANHHRVIAVELQGHGRTADIDRRMTFEHLAADVVGLLDHLGIERTDVFGFSNGGLTTYELLVHHPRRIRRAVVASADYRNDRGGEVHPERLPTEADFAAMRDAYAAVAPDPTHFEAIAEKTMALVHGCDGWTDDQLRGIDVPVLVLIGDTDFILVPNAAQAAELIPHGQLAVLPGTTHMDMTRSELVAPVVEAFLRRNLPGAAISGGGPGG